MRWSGICRTPICLAVAAAAFHAPQDPAEWVRRAPKLAVLGLTVPNARTSLEYPKRDWLVLPAGGSVVVSLSEKHGYATVQLERTLLRQPLAPEDVTNLFVELEVQRLQEVSPEVTGLVSRLVNVGRWPTAVLQYHRPGPKGPIRVRQFSIPVGDALFRLVCAAQIAQFPKIDPIFAHIAASIAFEGPR